MKKILLSIMAFSTCLGINAQNFSDDFESYAVGSYLGPQSAEWRTWSTTGEGTAEDTKITNLQANSGTNSVYYSSTSTNGGPQDCVLDFINTHTDGVFTFQADFYVNTGKTAYFNFQANATIGNLYAMDVNMNNGTMQMQNSGILKLSTTYPQATWFTMTVECNLTTKIWELKIDGVSAGKWLNTVNSVRYADIYPIMNSQFYVDNVSYTYAPYTVTNLNAAAADLNMGGNIATQVTTPKLKVVNAGTTTITSFIATLNYNGNNYPLPVTGISLASLASTEITFPSVTLAAGNNLAVATISNVNGTTDNIPSDDMSSKMVNPVVPALGKMVVGEEGTGTWCQWCPRGAVYMDLFEQDFADFWAGIAVHNSDPMTVTEYDAGMGGLISGYPSALVDRGSDVDPSGMTPDFYARLQTAPTAFITNGATWDPTTRTLNVSVSADFQAAANNNYKIACVLTEDDVTGTGSGYNQANAYAGGGNGVMGGFELLPSSVPAAQMVYNHVARAIQPSFTGYASSFPSTVNAGDVYTVNFLYVLPATWDENNIHIIGMMMDPNGKIDNAGKATITEAVANGYVNGTFVGLEETTLAQMDDLFSVYPNPTSANTTVAINLSHESTIELKLIDMTGKILAAKNYGTMNGSSTVTLNTADLNAGVYVVEMTVNNEKMTRRLVVQ